MPKKEKKNKNFNLAFIFIIVVIFFILLSFVIKSFLIIKESKFDGKHNINIEVVNKDNVSFVSFSPITNSVFILSSSSKINPNQAPSIFKIPIDGVIVLNDDPFSGKKLSSILVKSALFQNTAINLTSIDLIRLFLFTRSLKPALIHETNISQDVSDLNTKDSIVTAFSDPTIAEEGTSIEIVNATDVSGLGSRLASLVSNIGGNVILVRSEKPAEDSKIFFSGDKSYTVERLSKYLKINSKKSERIGVADITIVIGNESLKDLKY